MMKKEIKICLSFYKIAYSIFFTVVLSLVRGISYTYEIGVALEAPMALLAAVFCADTYVQEIAGNRSEVERLYPMKNRMASLLKRMGVQEVYLLVMAAAGYGMFYVIQRPISPYALYGPESGADSEGRLFFWYIAAIAIDLIFWGIFSLILSGIFRSFRAGTGGSLLLWLITNSSIGERVFGKWNLFSYAFRNIENSGDFSWFCGKAVCIAGSIFMAAMFPKIIKKV